MYFPAVIDATPNVGYLPVLSTVYSWSAQDPDSPRLRKIPRFRGIHDNYDTYGYFKGNFCDSSRSLAMLQLATKRGSRLCRSIPVFNNPSRLSVPICNRASPVKSARLGCRPLSDVTWPTTKVQARGASCNARRGLQRESTSSRPARHSGCRTLLFVSPACAGSARLSAPPRLEEFRVHADN